MSGAIGLRVYRISVYAKGQSVPVNSKELHLSAAKFFTQFIKGHGDVTKDDGAERTWYFQKLEEDSVGCSAGLIHYGTFGFESTIVDSNTKQKNYVRKPCDIEEVPLFYEIWCPTVASNGFVVFQSFQGRSCIQLVMKAMKESFEEINQGYMIAFKKVMPEDYKGSVLGASKVVRMKLVKRGASGDIADRYFSDGSPDSVNIELSIKARRNGVLGSISSLQSKIASEDGGVLVYDGVKFEKVVAEVRVGKKTRRIGVYGSEEDSGVIDVTEQIKKGSNGHPIFSDIRNESRELITDFYGALKGVKDEN